MNKTVFLLITNTTNWSYLLYVLLPQTQWLEPQAGGVLDCVNLFWLWGFVSLGHGGKETFLHHRHQEQLVLPHLVVIHKTWHIKTKEGGQQCPGPEGPERGAVRVWVSCLGTTSLPWEVEPKGILPGQ